jgi:L-ascorbate metabolism protein UlaG (beta-lactamase superfamily)
MEHNTITQKTSHEVVPTSATSKGLRIGHSIEGRVPGIRTERIQASPNYQNGKFVNSIPTDLMKEGALRYSLKTKLFGERTGYPTSEIPIKHVSPESLKSLPSSELRTYWLGHSSVLIEIDGIRLLIDPVFSKVVSPVSFLGPKRFHPLPIALTNLPKIDAVVISHDHHDHLDKEIIKYLAAKGTFFLVPLGIGTHLRKWKIQENQFIELDWWESYTVGQVRLICTPARHFSGRNYFDYNRTFWSSWSIVGTKYRVFYSGDTGYSKHFQEIGHRFGPFDLTLMKVGGYDHYWPDIHLNPEQATDAHLDVRGRRLLPVHWSAYDLSLHDWDEPIKRTVKAAKQKNIDLITPHIGEFVDADLPFSSTSWWEKVR